MSIIVNRIRNHIRYRLSILKKHRDYRFLIRHGVDTEWGNVTLIGKPIIRKTPGSIIHIGKGVVLTSSSYENPGGINHPVILATWSKDSCIDIFDNVGMSGVSINCVSKIVIGSGTMFGANANVWDTDFHPVSCSERLSQKSILDAANSPIFIGQNCWIGANCTILKGVTIGDNVVVGSMSLVNKDLFSNTLYAGVPVKKIRDI